MFITSDSVLFMPRLVDIVNALLLDNVNSLRFDIIHSFRLFDILNALR